MAEGGRILAEIIGKLNKEVRPGIATKDLDRAVEALIFKYGAKPSFKGYQGFPAALCVSVNDELVHIIPSERVLEAGDMVSLDLGIFYKGFHADMAITILASDASSSSDDRHLEALRLIRVTKKALKRGIKKARAGNTFGDIGNTIQRYVEGQGFNVVRDLCGHGIGKKLHEDPKIPNYGKRHKGEKIREGMVFCIEPMVTVGDWRLKKAEDGFGYKTKDGSLSSHFEHTVAVLKNGPKILTKC